MFNTFCPVVLFKKSSKPTLESPFISGDLLQFKQFKGAEGRLVLIIPHRKREGSGSKIEAAIGLLDA